MTNKNNNLLPFFQSLNQWPDIMDIVDRFDKENYKAWLVGGCVRDALCGLIPKDIDFVTDAKPQIIEKFFKQTLPIGKNFGTIVVCKNNRNYEVTSFRGDGHYRDKRHPESVYFSDPKTDAKRRDFTCNALFFDIINNQLIDFVGGLKDILQKQIRAVGVAEDRFAEDALRLFRAIRFAAQLGWSLEQKTYQAIEKQRSQITLVSIERVREELFKTLLAKDYQKGLKLLESTKLFQVFVGLEFLYPPLSQVTFYGGINVRLATLTYHWPLDHTESFLKKIKLSNKTIKYILSLSSTVKQDIQSLSLSHLRPLVTHSCFEDICCLLKGLQRKKDIDLLYQIKQKYPKLPALYLSGEDLINIGFSPGKKLGDLLKALKEGQLNNKIQSKEDAIKFIKEKFTN